MRNLLFVPFFVVTLLGCDPEHHLPDSGKGMESGNKSGSDDEDPGVQPTWDSIYKHLVVTSCLKCHSSLEGKKPEDGIDLITYQSMNDSFTWPPLITPGDPESSLFYLSIADGSMPKKSSPVSADVVEVVRQWILNGAKETDAGDASGASE